MVDFETHPMCCASRRHAIVLALLAALAGCGGSSSHGQPSSPPPDAPPVQAQVCQGAQPSPTACKACGCDRDCDQGEACADEATTGSPDGSCIRGCASPEADCPDGYVCEEVTPGNVFSRSCFFRCAASTDCRPGYICAELGITAAGTVDTDTVCQPRCTSDADCPITHVCDPYYGLCGTRPAPGTALVGAACTQDADCISSFCAVGPGFPGGYCTALCSVAQPDCPTGTACEVLPSAGSPLGLCAQSCAQASDCRADYQCAPGDVTGAPVCIVPTSGLGVVEAGAGSGMVSGDSISCGTICRETVSRGQVVTLTAVPAPGSTFAGWMGCDAPNQATCTMTLDATKVVTATFDLIASPQVLKVTKDGSGAGTVLGGGLLCGSTCSEVVAPGTSITLTANAASGATFTGWTGCDTSSGTRCTVAMTATRTVTASFSGTCTPDETRCIAGDPGDQERCSAAGVWTQESCDPLTFCAANTCRVLCGMTSPPVNPTLCFAPIADGVNDGEWTYAASQLNPGTYVLTGTSTSLQQPAEILPAPGQDWPFAWRLDVGDVATVLFQLQQFGSFQHPAFGYRAQMAGIHATLSPDRFDIDIRNSRDSIGNCLLPASSTWATGTCKVVTPTNQLFNYIGGYNLMGIGILTPKAGGIIDLIDLNFVSLTIAP